MHLDPGLYLYEFGKYGIRHLHTRNDSLLPSQASTAQHEDPVVVEPDNPEPMNPDAAVQKGAEMELHTRYLCPSHCSCMLVNALALSVWRLQSVSLLLLYQQTYLTADTSHGARYVKQSHVPHLGTTPSWVCMGAAAAWSLSGKQTDVTSGGLT